MNPIQTIRYAINTYCPEALDALAALAELEAQQSEIWKDVAGYEGLYQVSSEGRLKNIKTDYILRSASLVGSGYVKADLWKDGSKVQTTMHRVVAEAFLGNTAGMEVNHINGIKTDNRIANLEVVTRSENEQHSRDILGRLVKPVIAINLETGAETEYASIEAAGRDGFEPSCVYRCVRADHRIHKGHKFRLKNPEQLHVKHFLEAAPVAQQPLITIEDSLRFRLDCTKERLEAAERECSELRAKLKAQQPQAEPLCEDEGCPHSGTKHVCISPPQAEVAPMSQPNRLIAYSAAAKLRGLGYQWDEEAEAWAPQQVESVPIATFDGVIPTAIRGYLRRCSSGGMSKKHIDIVQASVDEAERLGYFKLAIAEAILASRAAPQQAEAVPSDVVRRRAIREVADKLETLRTSAHFIFNNPPGEASQAVRDVIEWYAGSIIADIDAALAAAPKGQP